jgi:hypothetical protein
MPQAEYEVWGPRSKTTMSNSGRRRFACEAALIPAASPPMTTNLALPMLFLLDAFDAGPCVCALFRFPYVAKECVASMAGRLENKMCYIGEYNEK